jgi:hypothetical protein
MVSSMPRRPWALSFSVITVTVVAVVVLGCGSGPSAITCATTADSVTYSAEGSCSGAVGGSITISTQPGLCTLLVKGGDSVGIPAEGQFEGTASKTNFDLNKGSWYLSTDQGNAADGSVNVLCETSVSTSGVIQLSCSSTICPADDCTGGSCNFSSCTEHLTPM